MIKAELLQLGAVYEGMKKDSEGNTSKVYILRETDRRFKVMYESEALKRWYHEEDLSEVMDTIEIEKQIGA